MQETMRKSARNGMKSILRGGRTKRRSFGERAYPEEEEIRHAMEEVEEWEAAMLNAVSAYGEDLADFDPASMGEALQY